MAEVKISELRPGQRECIEPVLRGRNTLGVLPTGKGKTLCALVISHRVLYADVQVCLHFEFYVYLIQVKTNFIISS